MKKAFISGTVAILLGLIVAMPLSAQAAGPMGRDRLADQAGDLNLIILIDQMNLSTDQMQALHDALARVVEQASGLKDIAASFRQDLIKFQGDEDALNALIQDYRAKIRAAMTNIREQAQEAMNSLKDSLTIKQGELLREALMSPTPRMGITPESGWMGKPQGLPPRPGFIGTRPMDRFGTPPWTERSEGFRPTQPQAGLVGEHPMLNRGQELLVRANKIVHILEMKLQAVGS